MSGDIETLVASVYDALAIGDGKAVRAQLADDFTAHFADGLPVGGGSHPSPDRTISDGWWALGRAYAVRAQPQEYIACADGRLLVRGRYVGSRRDDPAVLVDAAFMHLWTARDGLLVALEQLTDTARWR